MRRLSLLERRARLWSIDTIANLRLQLRGIPCRFAGRYTGTVQLGSTVCNSSRESRTVANGRMPITASSSDSQQGMADALSHF